MAKFVFQLETVLRHRERIVQDRQRDVAGAVASKTRVENEIRTLDAAVGNALADLRTNHLVGKIDLTILTAHRRFMLAMQRQGLALVDQLHECQKKLIQTQNALVEAVKQKKILEKLRELQQRRWQDAIARKELAEADEIAMQMTHAAALTDSQAVAPEALG